MAENPASVPSSERDSFLQPPNHGHGLESMSAIAEGTPTDRWQSCKPLVDVARRGVATPSRMTSKGCITLGTTLSYLYVEVTVAVSAPTGIPWTGMPNNTKQKRRHQWCGLMSITGAQRAGTCKCCLRSCLGYLSRHAAMGVVVAGRQHNHHHLINRLWQWRPVNSPR